MDHWGGLGEREERPRGVWRLPIPELEDCAIVDTSVDRTCEFGVTDSETA